MSYINIDKIDVFNCNVLIGIFESNNIGIISSICENINNISCKIIFKNVPFYIKIIKNEKNFKMKISSTDLCEKLIYFLNNLPSNIEILILNAFILKTELTNLPHTLKKIYFLSRCKPMNDLFGKVKNSKIPAGTKIYYKVINYNKYELDSSGKIISE